MPGAKKTVKKRLADGTLKTYTYDRKPPQAKPNTVGAVIAEYRASPDWRRLKPKTKQAYMLAMDRIGEFYAEVPIADVRRRTVLATRDTYADTVGVANQMVTMWGVLLRFALDREYVQINVARDIPRLKGGAWEPWTDEQIAYALDALPEYLRRAVVVALYTGQRAGDVVAMKWSDYDGQAIRVKQEKTGADLWVPCHADLRAELEAWRRGPRNTTHLVTMASGQPWRETEHFTHTMSRTLRNMDGTKGCVFHGLRKTAAVRLAEAGCTAHEIMAVTGHRTYAMVQHYTERADQRRRAEAAVTKLENWRGAKR